tara:strand:+ start:2279 stop:2794 length:516 start_codon:yes stop_codon:yes gene_type:complete
MLLILLIILIFIGISVGVAWHTGNLPGTKKYEQKRYMSYAVIPKINEIVGKNFSSDNKPSIEDIRKARLVCDGMEDRDIDPRSVPSKNTHVLEMCGKMTYMDVMEVHEFYSDFVALKEKDPTFENPDQDSQMCLRINEMNVNNLVGEVSEYDTYKDDMKLLGDTCAARDRE